MEVPFYGNTSDNKHCYEAVLRMILKFYLPGKEYSWDVLDEMTGKKKGLYTWPQRSYVAMRQLGFEIKVIGVFSYDEFIKNGVKYLEKEFGKEVAEDQEKNSDIEYEIENIKNIRDLIQKETRTPSSNEIVKLLSDGFLIECNVNSKSLAGATGYASHSVLIFKSHADSFTLHDPGLPPKKSLEVKFNIFNRAWAYPNEKSKSITAFRIPST